MKIALCKQPKNVAKYSHLDTSDLLSDIKEDHLFERKEDGVRAIAVDGELYNRDENETGKKITHKFPEIEVPENYALDGEIVNDRGVGSLTGRINCSDDFRIELKAKRNPATYRVFDLIMIGSTDYRLKKLHKRKAVLGFQEEVRDCENVETVPFYNDGEQLWKKSKKEGWEGIVAKQIHSTYPHGRSDKWLKLKNFDTEVFNVVDYGYTDDRGFVIEVELDNKDTQKIVVNEQSEIEKIKNSDVLNLKAEVRFLEKTEDLRLRHIAYEGII